ncbi:adenylate kinase [Roseovarius atlanticus]|nr:adenylate kinase [Roseovarius atlanticus]MBY6126237.1 adenylate kinase [Roseovarius atlanticus]MBY6150731.1 adenylate kinase [Roseovarius atlanticus]
MTRAVMALLVLNVDGGTDVPRIYVIGASCSGVSTLGATLSAQMGVPVLDVDDFYWMPTDPPFTTKRPPADRVRLIRQRQSRTEGWVLSGSFMGWGDILIEHVEIIAFLYTPTAIRLRRLERREAQRHGDRILPGGDMHDGHLAFRDWASRYDDPSFTGRNLAQHERWLEAQTAPVLRLDGTEPADVLAKTVTTALERL